MHSKGNVLYILCIFFNKTSACIHFSCLLCLQKPSLAPRSQACLVSYSATLHMGGEGSSYPLGFHLGTYLGAHTRQGAEGLVGLLIGGLAQLLKPGQPTLFF